MTEGAVASLPRKGFTLKPLGNQLMRTGLLLESVILNLHPQCATWKCRLAAWRHQSTRDNPVPAQARIPSSFSRISQQIPQFPRQKINQERERE
jgi:hypothetical protein